MTRWRQTLGLLALASLAARPAPAGGPPAVHAIEKARIVVAPGRVVETGTVVLRDGVVAAVGAEVAAPPDARLWDGAGLTVYPGLIEPYSPRARVALEDAGKSAGGGHPNSLVRPETEVTDLAPDPALDKKLREAGFTTALLVPKDGILRGEAAVVNLGEGDLRSNLLRRQVAQGASFASRGQGEGYPGSLMGAVALFRQSVLDAGWYAKAEHAFRQRPGQTRPAMDASLAALQPVAAGQVPVLFETGGVLDGLRAARLARELGLAAWLVGKGDEYRWLDELAATRLPLILPLDFPADPSVEGDELALSLDELRHWDRAPDNPRAVLDAGLEAAFTSFRLSDPAKVHASLAKAVSRGLAADRALAALTTVPAALLGIADRAGTLEPGKMANLVVVEGDLFVDKPKIREVWIDGRRYEVKESKAAEVDPRGTWEVAVQTGSGEIPLTLVIEGSEGAYTGSAKLMGNTFPMRSAEVSGKTLEAIFDASPLGQVGEVVLRLTIEGDSAKGGSESPWGSAPITATRTAKPPAGKPEAVP